MKKEKLLHVRSPDKRTIICYRMSAIDEWPHSRFWYTTNQYKWMYDDIVAMDANVLTVLCLFGIHKRQFSWGIRYLKIFLYLFSILSDAWLVIQEYDTLNKTHFDGSDSMRNWNINIFTPVMLREAKIHFDKNVLSTHDSSLFGQRYRNNNRSCIYFRQLLFQHNSNAST